MLAALLPVSVRPSCYNQACHVQQSSNCFSLIFLFPISSFGCPTPLLASLDRAGSILQLTNAPLQFFGGRSPFGGMGSMGGMGPIGGGHDQGFSNIFGPGAGMGGFGGGGPMGGTPAASASNNLPALLQVKT